MKKNRAPILRIFLREVAMIPKDHSLLLTLLIAPLLYAFFYGSIYINKEEENVKLGLVDDDNTSLSRLLAQNINNSPVVEIIRFSNLGDAKEQMYRGNCQGYLYIPLETENNLLSLKQANVVMAVNAARFLPSSDLLLNVQQICLTVGAGVRLQYFEKSKGLSAESAMQQVMPINLDYHPLFNERSSYGAFLLPGLLALILQQTLLIGLSESTAAERQHARIASWAQFGVSNAIWGKGLFYLLLYAAYSFFFLNINFSLLNLPMRANGWELVFLMLVFILTLIPLAQVIGLCFKSQLICLQVMAFSTYPIFLITGYVWPFESLPLVVQGISNLLPTTPFLKMYVNLVQGGGALLHNYTPLLHLITLFAFYSVLCFWRLRKLHKIART
ncbi:ABC transporter permease [Olivibacter domesticus]|uniref:ABC transporter permease n=1 Tax=Olivibacter domesticus TaxID=407022 RepID=UPI00360E3812